MKTEIKIIRALIDSKELTIRELSKRIKADYKITHTAAQMLIEKGIINAKPIGKSTLCALNSASDTKEIYLAEEERKSEILKTSDIRQLYKEVMSKMRDTFFIWIIFGSYAKKTHSKKSDIDMIFISNEKSFDKKINDTLSLLPLKSHALVFTEPQFKNMLNEKRLNVAKEALASYVILYNIEGFYRIKND